MSTSLMETQFEQVMEVAKRFYETNPAIKKSIELFSISDVEYKKAIAAIYQIEPVITTSSTSGNL